MWSYHATEYSGVDGLLQEKIKKNIKEYKEGKFVSRAQAIAVSYSQVSKANPYCRRHLKRKSGGDNKVKKSRPRKSVKKSKRPRKSVKKSKRPRKSVKSKRKHKFNLSDVSTTD